MLRYLWRRPLALAREAARAGQWAKAANFYRQHLDRKPRDAAARIQLGHSLKEQGDFMQARVAYLQATQDLPNNLDSWIHLAHAERLLGNRQAAVGALCEGLTHDPHAEEIIKALLAMGERERLPDATQQVIEVEQGIYTLSRYPFYRPQWHIPATLKHEGLAGLLVAIDGRYADPEWLQEIRGFLAGTHHIVVGHERIPIPSSTQIFHPDDRMELDGSVSHILLVEAGSRLSPDIISHLHDAMERTGAMGAYCDHDHWDDTVNGNLWQYPCFQPIHDPYWFSHAENCPPSVLISRQAIDMPCSWADLFSRRILLPINYVHVPKILASRRFGSKQPEISSYSPIRPVPYKDDGIQVIIQTRDAPAMVERCVASLLRTAARPERLDIVIINNRSTLTETENLFRKWENSGTAQIINHDEDFNWSKANNIGTAYSKAPHILFLNNDVEIETDRWDIIMENYILNERTGIIGALLLYPDRIIQHAGVIFGMGAGSPVHEGVGSSSADGGPNRRWVKPRLASAVTGAWLATSRSLFNEVGGFDEQLAVAYNDIDFCLRCRAAGQYVVQASDIVAIHRESATRGTFLSAEAQQREHEEWQRLQSIWGEALKLDPAYNPHWLRTGQPFDGFHAPTPQVVARWIEQSVKNQPWAL